MLALGNVLMNCNQARGLAVGPRHHVLKRLNVQRHAVRAHDAKLQRLPFECFNRPLSHRKKMRPVIRMHLFLEQWIRAACRKRPA